MCISIDISFYECNNVKKAEPKNFPKDVIVKELGLIDMCHVRLSTISYEYTSYPV
jgi:hypothetical protein